VAQTPLVLVCDDQMMVHETLKVYLESDGLRYDAAYDGQEALEKIERLSPDMVVLDIMMPKVSGIDVCRQVRRTSRVPIIMLTARGEEIDRILGLELGADDYIVKPFSPREVTARIKAVLRRIGEQAEQPASSVLRYGNLEINLSRYEVRVDGQSVPCTPKEVEVLHLLASHPSRVFDREQILSQVWGYDYFGDTRSVDTQIKRIRQKLPTEGVPYAIKTIYGVGYKFEVDDA
jgi:DNA-binding response OmpR family regulator